MHRLDRSPAPLPPPAEPPPACRIGYCSLWTQGTSVFCLGHDNLRKGRGRPDVDEFIASEYPRDTWRLRNLGIDQPEATISFARIPQPWLRELAKRYALAAGHRAQRQHGRVRSPGRDPVRRLPRRPA